LIYSRNRLVFVFDLKKQTWWFITNADFTTVLEFLPSSVKQLFLQGQKCPVLLITEINQPTICHIVFPFKCVKIIMKLHYCDQTEFMGFAFLVLWHLQLYLSIAAVYYAAPPSVNFDVPF